ncbi:MAG: four helix bundle protein [Pirellulales bacterium]
MAIRSFRDLEVWQRAMDLASEVYSLSASFPKAEQYGLTSQIRRSAVSVPSNIAEGHSRKSTREFLNFLSIALGSVAEVQTQTELAHRFGYFDNAKNTTIQDQTDAVGRLLNALIGALNRKLNS